MFICLVIVDVGFGYFAVVDCKDLWNDRTHLAKWYGHHGTNQIQQPRP